MSAPRLPRQVVPEEPTIRSKAPYALFAAAVLLAFLLIGAGGLMLRAHTAAERAAAVTPTVPVANQPRATQSPPTRATATATLAQRATATVKPTATATASRMATATATTSATATAVVTPTATAVVSATATLVVTPTATAATAATAAAAATTTDPYALVLARMNPDNPVPYLAHFRLVTFYGTPLGPQLGVLGQGSREQMLARLRQVADQYQALAPNVRVIPTFHIISTVADAFPGAAGAYSHQVGLPILDEWVRAAETAGAAVILDIQPGHADLQAEFDRIKHYLYLPHVHLALDPEFTMTNGGVPGQTLGALHADQVNAIQAQLEAIALETGVKKVLILHQFETRMLPDKAAIQDFAHVELVVDADGFGGPGAKIGDYTQYAAEPAFEYGGFKLFYEWDAPLLAPADVMSLDPVPAVIVYQ